MRYYPYSEFLQDVRKLSSQITEEFDTIVAIARGGLTLAHFLAEAKGVRSVVTINSIGYDEQKKRDKVDLAHIPDLRSSKKVLVVDDIVDSGDTMKAVVDELRSCYPSLELRSAVLFYKKSANFKADFFVQYADEWIDFFWTRDMNDTDDRQL